MTFLRKHAAFLALLIATIIWGATAVVMKATFESVPPMSLAFIRFSVASLLLLPFVVSKLAIKTEDIPQFLLAGIVGLGVHIALFFWGLNLTTALNTGVLGATAPLFNIFVAHVFLAEKIRFSIVLSTLVGALGITLILAQSIMGNGLSVSPLGDAMVLLATLAFFVHEVSSKKLFKTYDASVVTFYSFVIGSLFFLPFALFEWHQNPTWIMHVSQDAIYGILYGILLSSFAAYILWNWGLSKTSVSQIGVLFYLNPVITALTAVVFLKEITTPAFLVGACFIFLGLFLSKAHIRLPLHHHLKR